MKTEKVKPTAEKVSSMFDQVFAEKGYVVIGTKPGVVPYERGHEVNVLFGIPVESDWVVDAFTDSAEYVEQMKRFSEIRPEFPWKLANLKIEGGEHFYRMVKRGLGSFSTSS